MNINEEEREVVDDILNDFVDAHYLLKNDINERAIIFDDNEKFIRYSIEDFPFQFIGFNVTDKCNFACKYCIAGANKVKTTYSNFDKLQLKSYIYKFADELKYNGKKDLNIGFTGGEPLLYWNILKDIIVDVTKKYSTELSIEYLMNTNVSLVNDEIAKFFKQYNIKPFTSLDGTNLWNNKVRIYKNGHNTFNDIMRGITILRDNGVPCETFYLTLTRDNFDFSIDELLKFAKENGFKSITIEPDLVNVLDLEVEKICTKLINCYKAGISYEIDVMGFWRRPFNNIISFNESTNGFCRALALKSIVVDKDGFISPCGYSKLKISKVNKFQDIIQDEKYISFIRSNLRGNIQKCKGCKIEGICKGGCLISREIGQENNMVFKYRCDIYLKMTELLLLESTYGG